MKKVIANLILLIAIAVIGIMVVGILLYNYIPNDVTVAKAKTYEVSSETTKVLSDAAGTSNLLSELTGVNGNAEDSIKTTVILQTYHVTSGDLAVYQQSGAYQKGKADPFDEAPADAVGGGTAGNAGTTGTTNNGGNNSDGTLFNSTNKK